MCPRKALAVYVTLEVAGRVFSLRNFTNPAAKEVPESVTNLSNYTVKMHNFQNVKVLKVQIDKNERIYMFGDLFQTNLATCGDYVCVAAL